MPFPRSNSVDQADLATVRRGLTRTKVTTSRSVERRAAAAAFGTASRAVVSSRRNDSLGDRAHLRVAEQTATLDDTLRPLGGSLSRLPASRMRAHLLELSVAVMKCSLRRRKTPSRADYADFSAAFRNAVSFSSRPHISSQSLSTSRSASR
jgi:hypothetical protein